MRRVHRMLCKAGWQLQQSLSMFLLALVLVCPHSSAAQASGLWSDSREERDEAYWEFVSYVRLRVQEALKALEDVASPPTDNDARFVAIDLLGFVRAPEGVGVLAEFIAFQNPDPPDNLDWKELSFFPAAQALVRIGEPSVPACLSKLLRANEVERRNVVAVLERLEGRHRARAMIRESLRKTNVDIYRTSLRKALKLLQ